MLSAFLLPRPGGDGVKLERTFSIIQRWENYQAGFKLWQQPIFGLGFNTLRYYNQDYLSHASAGQDSSLLFVAVTTGLVGLTAYLFWLKSIFFPVSCAESFPGSHTDPLSISKLSLLSLGFNLVYCFSRNLRRVIYGNYFLGFVAGFVFSHKI